MNYNVRKIFFIFDTTYLVEKEVAISIDIFLVR